ncbi:MAG: Rieske 2Fe-2S domain-containing protein [Pseudomonadales bacterium]|nr:Rieske 2Fe-2S domain-containing protein [Pseudomonadales bacterium]
MTILCSVNDVTESSAKGFEIDGHQVVAVKRNDQFYVYVNSCPHIGIMLEFVPDQFLDRDQQYIQCANHGALFEIESGLCIAGPCNGKALKPVAIEIQNNNVHITGIIPERF